MNAYDKLYLIRFLKPACSSFDAHCELCSTKLLHQIVNLQVSGAEQWSPGCRRVGQAMEYRFKAPSPTTSSLAASGAANKTR